MAINFTEDKKYPNQNISERRETTYKPQTSTKNTVDNSSSIMYNNKNKQNSLFTFPLTDFENQWKEKNQGLFKYAGDSAKKSVDKGLKEAHDYMQDADEGTSFENVQTASVKRHLANDANDEKLLNASIMEMIGHLSKDNKEDYLKHAQPLQTYIDVKDEFDFKHNNYTTTENIDKTPDENVRQLQRELNEAGYTDKFGQKLKEDGLYAGKTAYADDNMKADKADNNNANIETYSTDTSSVNGNVAEQNYDEKNTSQRFGNRWNAPVRTGERPGERETSTDRQDTETNSNSNIYINDNGIQKWRELPYIAQRLPIETRLFRERKIPTEVYNAFDTLSQRWYYAETEEAREEIGNLAKKIRNNGYKIEDCTDEANKQLWENGQEMAKVFSSLKESIESYNDDPENRFKQQNLISELLPTLLKLGLTGIGWYLDVKPKGEWDYKAHIKKEDQKRVDWMPNEGYFLYYGQILSAADYGNINYGYTGTILGLSPETLYEAGGMVAPSPTQYEIDNYYRDSEVDHYWVKKGIEQANKEGYIGILNLPVNLIFEIL